MTIPRPSFELYLRVTTVVGIVLLAAVVAAGADSFGPLDMEFWLLAALVLLGELFPIQVHGQVGEETFSTPFGFATLLIFGVPEVLVVQVAGSLLADVIRRRPADRIAFNVAQLSISWVVAGALLDLLGGSGLSRGESLEPEQLPAIVGAAALFFAANSTLVRTAEALLEDTPIVAHLREDLLFRGWSAGVLFALGPPVAVIAEDALYLVPLIALPMAAVQRASKQASEMERLALSDPLTGLPNRSLLRQRSANAVQRAAAARHGVAVLTLDLDRFRDVNDTVGRAQGDALLVEVGARLAGCLRAGDTLARVGEDNFGVLLPEITERADAAATAAKLLETVGRPLEVAGVTLSVDASVGIACFPDHGSDVELLLQHADTAMYRAKRAQSRFEFYAPELDEQAPRRLALVTSLKQALDAGRIDLHYQPKVELTTERVVGVEALARWTDPALGAVPPTTFIPLAERTGLIAPFTERTLELATDHCQRWQAEGFDIPVAVNVSTRVLLDPGFPAAVAEHLRRAGLEGRALEIEITESTLMSDRVQARHTLAQLSAQGVRTSIDDFGTGYSSLAYLRELRVHALKIDRSFIQGLGVEADSDAIVHTIVELARNLGLETVAEGVEDTALCPLLASLGCDCVQGFALAPPMPADRLREWLMARGEGTVERPTSREPEPGAGAPG